MPGNLHVVNDLTGFGELVEKLRSRSNRAAVDLGLDQRDDIERETLDFVGVVDDLQPQPTQRRVVIAGLLLGVSAVIFRCVERLDTFLLDIVKRRLNIAPRLLVADRPLEKIP